MEEVQSWWEVPAISYYCSLLGHAFGLPEFNIESLERSLASEEVLVSEICTVLLQAIENMPESSNWKEAASFTLNKHSKHNPFKDGLDSELSPWDRLDVLYSLCELRMECNDVIAILKNIEKWQLKVPAIGEDSEEMLYWYFTGTRIYCQNRELSEKRYPARKLSNESAEKQSVKKLACESLLTILDTPRSNLIKPRPGPVHWSVVAHTLPECVSFTAKFEKSTEPEEETLYRNLAKVVLPQVRSVVQEEERRMNMAGGGRGLTRSGRKVVARYKNGFVATPKDETEVEEEKEQDNGLVRSSKRRRTQPPQTTTPRRTTRSNSDITDVAQVLPTASSTARRTSRRVCKESSPEESHEESREDELESNDSHMTDLNKRKKKKKSIIVSKSSKQMTLKDQVEFAVAAATQNKRRTISPPEGADVELNDALNKVMVALVNHSEAWQFNEPVNEEFAPYYYQLTKNPRDFNQIDKNVIEYKYGSAEAFANDIHLVFTNCFDYNGPLNEYTRVARVLEKYFRRLMREFFDDFTFEVTSVIHPRKRPFVNRHKRIKEIQRGEISSIDETSRESTDDSHRDRRKPGPKPGHNKPGQGHRTDGKSKRRWVRRKKTEDQQQVSFTDLLSDTYPPQYQYPPHPSYHPNYHPGYHGYQYPPHMYDYHRAVNNEPTYIELSPARPKVQPKEHYKHDDEPLLFPLLPRRPLPRPSLPASSVPEEHMLRLLNANRPSQINSIDSTTAPSAGEITTTESNLATTSNDSKSAPSDSTTNPSDSTTNSSDSTTNSSDSTTNSSGSTTKPSDSTTNPSDSTTKISDSTTNPSDSTTNSSDSTTNSSGSTTKPSDSTTKPSGSTTKPSGSTTKPSDSTTKPSDSTTKPSDSTTKPSDSTTKPSDSTTKPSDSTTNHITPSDSTTTLSESEVSNVERTEKAAGSTKVNGTAQPSGEEQSLNNEALSKDTSEASPKKLSPETLPKPKPVERPVAEYAVLPVYPGYYPFDAGYTGQGYPGSPIYHTGYPYSPGYPHSYAGSPGYPMGYAGSPGYHPVYPGYSPSFGGYSYSPGTQYNGCHPNQHEPQTCVTPLSNKQGSSLVRPGRGRGSRGPRRGRGSRGSRTPRNSRDNANGHSNESNVNGKDSSPTPNVPDTPPWIDRGLDTESQDLSQKKKKESNVFDIRMKPKFKRAKT